MSILQLDSEPEAAELDEAFREYTGASHSTAFSKAASNLPDYFEGLVLSHRNIMTSGQLDRELKELIALATAMVNGCDYCIDAHATMQKRMYDRSDSELTHLAAIVGHVTAINRFEEAVEINSEAPLFEPPVRQTDKVFDEIRQMYGRMPRYFKIMGRDKEYLQNVWNREKATVLSGAFDQSTRDYIAYAVSATNGAQYSLRWRKKQLLEDGATEDEVFKALQVVELFCSNSKWATALMLEHDSEPE